MNQTLSQKIFARHTGRDKVEVGELVFAKVDLVLGTDVTVPLSVEVFRRMGAKKLFDPAKIALVNDHFVPAKDVKAAELSKTMRNFAREMGVKNYFEVGRSGICHVILPDKGLVKPGDLIVGADSHTCTYGALNAFSTGIGSTDMAAAWALGELWFKVPASIKVNLTGKPKKWIGGKDYALYVIVPHDDKTADFMAQFEGLEYEPVAADEDAEYSAVYDFDVSNLELQVAEPYLPSNAVPVSKVEGTKIDQVVIGSCTNGRMSDFHQAVEAMGGKPVADGVRLIVIPSTQKILLELIENGLAKTFTELGAVISPPTCGPCIGGHMGILAAGEVGLYTTNRNFVGRNGHPSSKVYLAGPAVAGASAAAGKIVHPENI